MKIAFLGLGAMGFPMAGHLAKKYPVTVWNRTTSVAQEHAKKHGTLIASSLETIGQVDVVFTMLPTSREVDEIVARVAPGLPRGSLWIDTTSGDPAVSRETAARLGSLGIDFLDAPVTGAIVGAENATLTIMVGGEEPAFARAKSLLECCGKKIVHAGPVGSGHAIKALTNSIMGATVWITAECLLLAKRYGIDIKTALEITNNGSGRSNASENLLPMRLADGKWPLVFKLAHHDKDIRTATAIAHRDHAATPLLNLTQALYSSALHQLGPNADYIEVAKVIATMNGDDWN